MSIVKVFSGGFRQATSQPRMVLVLYLLNLLMALPIAMAFRAVLDSGFGSSMAPTHLMGGLDFTVFSDFMNAHVGELSALLGQVSWTIAVFMLINSFLAGGIFTILGHEHEKFSVSGFFGGCGAYFGRFLRLFFLFAIILFLLALILLFVIALVWASFMENATSEVTSFVVMIILMTLFALPVMWLLMIADYSKVIVVVNNERRVLNAALQSTKFVFSHFFKTFGLELLMLLVVVALFAIYMLLDLAIGMTTDLTIVVMLIIQQLFMISRSWSKVFFFAGELSFYQGLQPIGNSAVESGGAQVLPEPAQP